MAAELAPESSATRNHLATPSGVKDNTEWLHLLESLDYTMLLGTRLLQDIVNNTAKLPPWPNSKSPDRI